MTGRYGTPFVESEALLGVTVGDIDGVKEILSGMSDEERGHLAQHCMALADLCRRTWTNWETVKERGRRE